VWGSRTCRALLTRGIESHHRFGMIAAVLLRLFYLNFWHVLGLVLLMDRTASSKDVELLVLRHEVALAGAARPLRRREGRRDSWCCGTRSPCNPRQTLQVDTQAAHTTPAPVDHGGSALVTRAPRP
jgi:hypothetical protein